MICKSVHYLSITEGVEIAIYIICPFCKNEYSTKYKKCPKCGKSIDRNKTFRISVSYGGKRVRKSIQGSITLAKEIEAKIKTELITGEYYDKTKNKVKKIAYNTFIKEQYLPNSQSKSSIGREETLLKYWIKPIIGKKMLSDITTLDIEKIKKNMLNKKMSPRTVEYALAVVRHTLNKAKDWGFLYGDNPVNKVEKPKINNQRIRFLNKEEAKKLLDEIKKRSQSVYEVSLLSLYTGMRFGEIVNLTWQDIDFENDIIHIKDPKNKTDRTTFMTASVKEMLGNRKNKENPTSQNEIIFKSSKGEKINKVSDTFKRSVKAVGLNEGVDDRRDKVVFHTLRHTFASWLAINGTPIYTIKELMGHKTLAMTERYSHLIPDVKREAIEKLEE